MTLVRWILETTIGFRPPETLTVGLFFRDQEVSARGYTRLPVKWRMASNRSVSMRIEFGPYDDAWEYDRYVLFAGEERVETIEEMPGGFRYPAGFGPVPIETEFLLGDPQGV